ncbi:DNA-binding domain-containing protein [Candidatus Nitronereus thalassa]|uniref:DNA-binding domain-containing protein n=1 Tax=Candidatus Nitronereus thalassa TaxID=3020898 RepID=A0ABU3KCB8_9BACT|nr:DNA-binding domain-containing protein [Candidatus Nitronereus thalassa]MDT7044043.1 DNA-binding domain-containing protein [Candidatus Nitronereus thalassa]
MDQLTLKHFQQLFSQATLPSLEPEPPPTIGDLIVPGGALTASDALNVYGTGVVVRLTEALGETFEAVWWVCGDDDFFQLAKYYIQTHPSSTYNLSHYGETFSEMLDRLGPFPDLPFLGDLARYEWLFKCLFHTKQHDSVAQDALQSLTEEATIRFHFGSAVTLFTSRYAIYDLWKLRGAEHDGTPPTAWDRPQSLVLYKKDKQIFIREVDDAEYGILYALHHGASLDAALASAGDAHPEFDQQRVSDLFQMMFHTGIIHHIDIQPSP